jgi:two-component system, chemotaxis family, chemotaxis protein CheY
MKILIVDDSKAMRMIVQRTLRQAGFTGHEMAEASNGAEALGVLRAQRFDLVLSDWNMPEMSGLELLAAVKSENLRVRFGFVTSEGSVAMREQASSAGAEFLIAKPFTTESFVLALRPIVGGAA